MNPLDIGDDLIDREKSRTFLHYLSLATRKFEERKHHHKENIENRLEAVEKHVNGRAQIHEKVKKLEHKLKKYVETAPMRKKRIEELERKISGKLTKTDLLKEAISDLEILKHKFADAPKEQKKKIVDKLARLKKELKRAER